MSTRRTLLKTSAAAAAVLAAPAYLRAQSFPSRPLRLIVASSAGGNADVVTRLMAPELEQRLGQRIVVENLAASSGMQGTEAVARAAPDGHTLLVGTASQLVFNLALFDPMPFDLVGSLRGVAMINKVPLLLLVNPNDPAANMRDYVARLRAAPGRYQYGSGPRGTTTHITGLMWARAAGVEVQHVPYRAGAEGLRDLMAGRISHQFDVAVTAIPHVQSRALRALAVTGRSRLQLLPDLPTAAEQGLPGFEGFTWNSIAAPVGTPQPVVERLNREIQAVLEVAALRERLVGWGSEFTGPMSPAQVDAFYAEDRRVWVPLVREASRPV
jgi:tripartite-type tricarboxylate transporter receptor subunit TctC